MHNGMLFGALFVNEKMTYYKLQCSHVNLVAITPLGKTLSLNDTVFLFSHIYFQIAECQLQTHLFSIILSIRKVIIDIYNQT